MPSIFHKISTVTKAYTLFWSLRFWLSSLVVVTTLVLTNSSPTFAHSYPYLHENDQENSAINKTIRKLTWYGWGSLWDVTQVILHLPEGPTEILKCTQAWSNLDAYEQYYLLPEGANDFSERLVLWNSTFTGDVSANIDPQRPVGEILNVYKARFVVSYGPLTGQKCSDGELVTSLIVEGENKCPESGDPVTGAVKDLHDGCYEECAVDNLSPIEDEKWVSTLQGVYTGKTCEEAGIEDEVITEKMLACGTVGSSDYDTKTDNPIDFAIGNKYFHDTDYRGTGNFPIVYDRSYNSLNLGWRFAYTQRVDRLSATEIAVRRPGGQSFEFTLTNGQWAPDPDVTDRLETLTALNGSLLGWRYRLSNNRQEHFDAQGRLLSIRNASGLEQTLTYSADGNQFTIIGPQGDALLVTLESNGLFASSIKDSQGQTTSYQYDGPYLSQVSHPNGTTKQYLYEVPERPWLITGVIDEKGIRSNTVTYDNQGRAIMSELANGVERVEVSYNDDDTTTLTNALGKRTTFHFQTLHGVKKIVRVEGEPTQTCQGTAMDYTFNDSGFLVEKVDAKGFITQYTRDELGRELTRTEAAGTPQQRTITTEWHPEYHLPLKRVEAGRVTSYTYDGQGRVISQTTTSVTE